MNKGKIIYLNGVTSTGKTTLSKSIQQIANVNFYHMSFDMFQQMISMKFLQDNYWKYLSESIIIAYYTAKTMSDMNINVIIDGMLLEMPEFQLNYQKSHYEIFKDIFTDSSLLLVQVSCPLEECRKRNIERGDRGVDQSDWQNDKMAKNIEYDFVVNTFVNSSNECAELILSKLVDATQL